MKIDYKLDQWEWQGVTQSIEIDPEDYQGMSADEIKEAVYAEIRRDAEQNLHLVYEESDVLREIHDALSAEEITEAQ